MDETEQIIKALTSRFEQLQKSLGLSDRAFVGRYRQLGSTRSWKSLLDGTWQGRLRPEKVLKNLQELAEFIDAALVFDEKEFLPALPFVRHYNAHFERLMGSRRDRRCMVVLAPEGCGKSWATSAVVKENPQQHIYLRLSDTFREKPFHVAVAMARKLGAVPEKNPASQMTALVELIKQRGDIVFMLDEGHNGGVAVMKLIKELIDETSARFVYQAFPHLFDRVRMASTGAMAEARQFLRRCTHPIFDDYREGIGAADVSAYLIGRGLKKSGDLETMATDLAPIMRANGNLSALADIVDDAESQADNEEKPMSLAMVKDAASAFCSTFQQRKGAQ